MHEYYETIKIFTLKKNQCGIDCGSEISSTGLFSDAYLITPGYKSPVLTLPQFLYLHVHASFFFTFTVGCKNCLCSTSATDRGYWCRCWYCVLLSIVLTFNKSAACLKRAAALCFWLISANVFIYMILYLQKQVTIMQYNDRFERS